MNEDRRLIFEKSKPGRRGHYLPKDDLADEPLGIDGSLLRDSLDLPEVSEIDVVRHYTNLSSLNVGVDTAFYPLGSCTMKYNPKVNEDIARMASLNAHPLAPEEFCQGNLRLMWELERYLCEITGMDACSLQPAAGAHGELLGVMLIKAYWESRGEKRTKILVPDSAHGTNPASCAMCGFEAVEIPSNREGVLDPDALKDKLDGAAGVMITNPNTLGLFEKNIDKVCALLKERDVQIYCDGANSNANMGVARAGDLGFDIIHLNLHKTFSTPHGGGGPGAGPVCVKAHLEPFLPKPRIEREGDSFRLDEDRPRSVGRIRAFFGNFGVLVRAYAYIRHHGPDGLKNVSENAVLNANYLMARLKNHFHLPYDRPCQHEFILTDKDLPNGASTLDVAKRLLDFHFHAPTVYFPLVVSGAIMIEPTETESKDTLDRFADAMIRIREEAEREPETLKKAPHTTPVTRLDEVTAARKPTLRFEAGRPEFD